MEDGEEGRRALLLSSAMGVFGSPGDLSHLSHAESSYAHYIQLSFVAVCLVAWVS
jgi:hypothetical protein